MKRFKCLSKQLFWLKISVFIAIRSEEKLVEEFQNPFRVYCFGAVGYTGCDAGSIKTA